MDLKELIDRLRAWARRYEPRSPERVLFLAAADALEANPQTVTVAAVEAAIGSPLLPWQRARLEARDTPPPSSVG